MSAGAGAIGGNVPPPDAENTQWEDHLNKILAQLLGIYQTNIEVLEQKFEYDAFKPSWFKESIVQKKPFITFLGPFSAGKSTFINYLMQCNYLLTGPQPVTDKFTVIMHGDEYTQIPGRVLCADASQPFRGLNQFGETFMECFNGLLAPHPILRSVHIIDTPGVLEAAGDIHQRRYDYVKVCRWFIEKSDLVFFLFDPSKLDAGIELRMLFKHALRGFEAKTRIVMNKADCVGPQELMRVYGSLFWNLSNLINTTEPPRVYISSFWDQPYKPGTNHELFTDEKADLIYDLTEVVPLQSLDKRVTSVLRRAQEVYIHSLVCATLRSKMPRFFGKDKAKAEAMAKLGETFEELAAANKLALTDFSPVEDYKAFFAKHDLLEMPDMDKCAKKQWLVNLKRSIDTELPALLKPIQTSSTIDPRDRKHALMLQRTYHQQLSDQLQGVKGQQGALGESASPVYRQETLPAARTMTQPQLQQQPIPVQQQMPMQQVGGPMQGSPAVQSPMTMPGGGQMSQEQMQMMMQMMMQMQGGQQPQQSPMMQPQ